MCHPTPLFSLPHMLQLFRDPVEVYRLDFNQCESVFGVFASRQQGNCRDYRDDQARSAGNEFEAPYTEYMSTPC